MQEQVKRLSYDEYQEGVGRTAAPLATKLLEDIHYVLGLSTELGEMEIPLYNLIHGDKDLVDTTNLKEEFGDYLWYFASLCNNHNIKLNELSITTVSIVRVRNYETLIEALTFFKYYTCEIEDLFKKRLAYNREINEKVLLQYLALVFDSLLYILRALMFNINSIMYNNIYKLKVRFPEKFTDVNANNRDLQSERQALEGEVEEKENTIIIQSKINNNGNN